ncbi:DUF2868 domain-containing protein [Hydrogenophaga sp.]|uniref:DUF2868 domain-containing protein n=1 Tax=Hydrogenophaga sp. TaxID=1904254 RepID=UPI003563F0CA
MNARPPTPSLRGATLAYAVRLIEENGPLLDGEEMVRAHQTHTAMQDRILARAQLLAQRLRLDRDLDRLRAAAWVSGLLLVLLAYLLAGGLLGKATGSGQTLNAALAFFSILTVPVFALLLWLAAVLYACFAREPSGAWSLGKWLMDLAARIPYLHGPNASVLVRALHTVLQQQRLSVWVLGAISHALWAAGFALMLLTLLALFGFQAYQLSWETTIFDPAFFARFLAWTSWLPGLMGFPVPESVPLNAGADPVSSHALAWWLVACTLVYGLLPRVLALLACVWIVKTRHARLALDTRDPYFRKLMARFTALDPTRIVDAEQAPAPTAVPPRRVLHAGEKALPLLIGFELPSEFEWPPAALAPLAPQSHRVSGSMEERSLLMSRLAESPAFRALVVCNGASSPDRGTERFLRQVSAQAHACALLLVYPEHSGANPQRWPDWLAGNALHDLPCWQTLEQARDWLGEHA